MSVLITPEAQVLDALVCTCWGRAHVEGRAEEVRSLAVAELDRALAEGLSYRRDGETRFFDLYEVLDAMHVRRGPSWVEGEVASLRDRAESFAPQHDWTTPRRFEVTVCREVGTAGRRPGSRMRFGIPLPVEEPRQQAIEITTTELAEGTTAEVTPGMLDVRAVVPTGEPVVRITLRIAATCAGVLPPTDPPARDLPEAVLPYLDTTVPIVALSSQLVASVTPRLVALARDVAGTADDPWTVVQRLWEFLFVTTRPGYVRHDLLDGPDGPLVTAIEQRVMDCRIAGAALTALCRARGVPARIVGGFQLFRYGCAPHWWCEVFVGGDWRPIDLQSWILGAGEVREPWSRVWLGGLDYRLVTERPPSPVMIGSGVRFTNDWHVQNRLVGDGGTESTYLDAKTGALLFRETCAARLT